MAESIIVNRVNGRNKFISVPTDATNAQSFATDFLEGLWAVYSHDSSVGSDVVGTAPDVVNVMFKNTTTGAKGYATIYVAKTKTDDQIFSTLMGLTLNGVLVDEAYVISRRTAERY